MKKLNIFFAFILIQSFLFGQAKLDYNSDKWTLIYEDEFTYSSKAQLMSNYEVDGPRCSQNTLYSWDNVNIDYANDYLVLKSTKFSTPQSDPDCPAGTFAKKYKGGGIVSIGNHSGTPCSWVEGFEYGMFEVRCKLPDESGAWPAWWFYNGPDEIDIFEFEGDKPKELTTNLHDWCGGNDVPASAGYTLDSTCPGNPWDDTHESCQQKHLFDRNLTQDFHTYTVVWTPSEYSFFMDGREIRTETRFVDSGCPQRFILNIGATDNANYQTSEFIIDYIRVYNQNSLGSNYMYDYNPGTVTYSPDIYNRVKSLDVGDDNQLFYRGTSNWVEHFYWNGSWLNGPLPKNSSTWKVGGDVVVGENNQTFYRGTDERIQIYYWSNGSWHHGWVDDYWNTSSYKVSSSCGALAVGEGNQLFYKGKDGWMHTFYWSGDWMHAWLPNSSSTWKVAGDVVVGEGNQVFYRGADGRMQVYYWSNGSWHHGWVDDFWSTSAYKISSECGAIEVGEGNQLFYRATDNRMHSFYYSNGDWRHAWFPYELSDQRVYGDIAVGVGNDVFYRGADGQMQMYYFQGDYWYHMWVDEVINKPTSQKLLSTSSIAVGTQSDVSQIFYRDWYGNVDNYYRVNSSGELVDPPCGYNNGQTVMRSSGQDEESLETNVNEDFTIYPNPTNGQVALRTGNGSGIDEATLFDAVGQVMSHKECDDCTEIEFDLTEFPNGLYSIRFLENGKYSFGKIVKQ